MKHNRKPLKGHKKNSHKKWRSVGASDNTGKNNKPGLQFSCRPQNTKIHFLKIWTGNHKTPHETSSVNYAQPIGAWPGHLAHHSAFIIHWISNRSHKFCKHGLHSRGVLGLPPNLCTESFLQLHAATVHLDAGHILEQIDWASFCDVKLLIDKYIRRE